MMTPCAIVIRKGEAINKFRLMFIYVQLTSLKRTFCVGINFVDHKVQSLLFIEAVRMVGKAFLNIQNFRSVVLSQTVLL